MRSIRSVRAFAAVCAAGCASTGWFAPAPPARAATGDVHHLNTLGDEWSYGYDVNASGQTTGFAYLANRLRAFRYDGTPGAGGAMRDLGTLGGAQAVGFGVNNAGMVAGYAETADDNDRAFRYVGTPGAGGVMHDLGTLGGRQSYGYAINTAGQVTGTAEVGPAVTHRAFRYDGIPGAGGVMRDLGTLPGDTFSSGSGVNDPGQVAGTSFGGPNGQRAFRYDGTPGAGGVMHDLGTLGGDGSNAEDVNNAGQVAGTALDGNGNHHAFRYDGTPGAGGVMRALASLGASRDDSYGLAINDAGFVIGYAFRPLNLGTAAALWRPDLSVVDLDLWLDTVNPAGGAPWKLREAYGISDGGFITGWGEYDDGPGGLLDGQEPFLLDASSLVPEPGSLGLLAAFACGARPRRRQTEAARRSATVNLVE